MPSKIVYVNLSSTYIYVYASASSRVCVYIYIRMRIAEAQFRGVTSRRARALSSSFFSPLLEFVFFTHISRFHGDLLIYGGYIIIYPM